MSRTFTTATDEVLIELIRSAQSRLTIVTPGLTTPVAKALAVRAKHLPTQLVTVILDADPETCRMGYGDMEALEVVQEASSNHELKLHQQPGIRIGVVISDQQTMVYSPVPRMVEDAPANVDEPNAVMIGGKAAEAVAAATASDDPQSEVGKEELTSDQVKETVDSLKADPPRPYDLSRRLRVFRSEVQFIELRIKNATFEKRKIQLPEEFKKLNDEDLRSRISAGLKMPIDLETELRISIGSGENSKNLLVNERYIVRERQRIEREFFHRWNVRGKVVLRKDKERVKRNIDGLMAIIKAYHSALREQIHWNREAFCQQFVDEFLDQWKERPPKRLRERDETDDESLRLDIRREAAQLFEKAVILGDPALTIVYKDVAIEDLEDASLMKGLEDLMRRADVSNETLAKLFSVTEAAPAKLSNSNA